MTGPPAQRIRKSTGSSVEEYVYDASGHQFAALQPNVVVTRSEIYAGARHLATYDHASNSTYFIHGDWPGSPATGLRRWGGWQGTERLRTTVTGTTWETCTNLPFGALVTELWRRVADRR